LKITLWVLGIGFFSLVIFFVLGKYSSGQKPLSLGDQELLSCGSKPNCVCSEEVQMPSQAIDPLRFDGDGNVRDLLVEAISLSGGVVIDESTTVISATYTSRVFGFVDDVVFKLEESDRVAQVISASRVGHSDLGANRKRIEDLRIRLKQ